MDLKEYFGLCNAQGVKATTQQKFAARMGVTQGWINRVIHNQCRASALRAVQIEQLTSGIVTRKELRPNDWDKLWPELADNN